MANINHSVLTDPYLHEPKGVGSASANRVYLSNGSGTGVWRSVDSHINGYIPFDAVTPAYQHAVTTSFTALNPTFSIGSATNFSGVSSPNAGLVYTGSLDVLASCQFVFNYKNASGTLRNLEVIFYLNGAVMNGGHIITSAESGTWKSATLVDLVVLSPNDLVEIYIKGDAAFTLDVASASLTIVGVPVV